MIEGKRGKKSLTLSMMRTEKNKPEDKQIMLETRFTEFSALSIYPRVGISQSTSETDV